MAKKQAYLEDVDRYEHEKNKETVRTHLISFLCVYDDLTLPRAYFLFRKTEKVEEVDASGAYAAGPEGA